ncbi:MAG: SDR family oxidoreductase [Oscillospiraceae bacterium]|nr:SDR family oxidoreductase [Oscillospiraceae bacterium]
MRFLVLGASGMAGHTIAIYLQEQGHDVIGFARRSLPFCNTFVGDVRDAEGLSALISNGKFDSVINCVGILSQFAEQDKEQAVYLNSYLPHFLSKSAKGKDTQIIHMSTDCVFSGRRGGYAEGDFRDGETFYDRTKALGELDNDLSITLRNSIIGPDINPDGIGLLNWFMKQDTRIYGYENVMWTGLTTLQLAKVMEAASTEKASGLYNMVYSQPISKYDLLVLLNHYLRNDSVNVNPVGTPVSDKSLIRTNYKFKYKIPDYETMISEMSKWIKNHRALYPHYQL